MIAYAHFQFASPPRTGTTWILRAAELAGLGTRFKTTVHEPHSNGRSATVRLTVVRHPADWLGSYWRSIYRGKIGVAAVDEFAAMPGALFGQFARAYLETMPGAVGRMFDGYRAEVCLRLEDMPWAFAEFLDSIGVPDRVSRECYSLGRMNIGRNVPRVSMELRRDIVAAEREFCERYDYE